MKNDRGSICDAFGVKYWASQGVISYLKKKWWGLEVLYFKLSLNTGLFI